MEDENTSVRITVHKLHERRFLNTINRVPDDWDDLAHPDLIDLTFDVWTNPDCMHFHCEGVPFLGFHDHSESFGPHRMCGDGENCMEIPADRDERLYVLVDDNSGIPDWESENSIQGFLSFENRCRERMRAVW